MKTRAYCIKFRDDCPGSIKRKNQYDEWVLDQEHICDQSTHKSTKEKEFEILYSDLMQKPGVEDAEGVFDSLCER